MQKLTLENVPSKPDNFLERNDEELKSILSSSTLGEVINIYGEFSVGKSTLLANYLHKLQTQENPNFSLVFWINTGNVVDLTSTIFTTLEQYQEKYQVSLGVFEGKYTSTNPKKPHESNIPEHKGKILIVIDGCTQEMITHYKDWYESITNSIDFKVVLISQNELTLPKSTSLKIDHIKDEEALSYLKKALFKEDHQFTESELNTLNSIQDFTKTDFFFLKAIISILINTEGKDITDKWKKIEEKLKDRGLYDIISTEGNATLINKYKKFTAVITKEQPELILALNKAVFLDPFGFSPSLLGVNKSKNKEFCNRSYGLINLNNHLFSIHPLQQQMWHARMSETEKLTAFKELLKQIGEKFVDPRKLDQKITIDLIRNAQVLIDWIDKENAYDQLTKEDKLNFFKITNGVALYYHNNKRSGDGEKLLKDLINRYDKEALGEVKQYLEAFFNKNILHNYVACKARKEDHLTSEEHQEAEKYIDDSITWQEANKTKGSEQEKIQNQEQMLYTARIKGRLLRYKINDGTTRKEALDHIEKQIPLIDDQIKQPQISKESKEPLIVLKQFYLFEKAQILLRQPKPTSRDLETARDDTEEFIKIQSSNFMKEVGYTILGEIHRAKGEHGKALEKFFEAYKLNDQLLKHSPSYGILRIIYELSLTYHEMNNPNTAYILIEAVHALVEANPELKTDRRVTLLLNPDIREKIHKTFEDSSNVKKRTDQISSLKGEIPREFKDEKRDILSNLESLLDYIHTCSKEDIEFSTALMSERHYWQQKKKEDEERLEALSTASLEAKQQRENKFKRDIIEAKKFLLNHSDDPKITQFQQEFLGIIRDKIITAFSEKETGLKAGQTLGFNIAKSFCKAFNADLDFKIPTLTATAHLKLGDALQGVTESIETWFKQRKGEEQEELRQAFDSKISISEEILSKLVTVSIMVTYKFQDIIQEKTSPRKFGEKLAKAYLKGCTEPQHKHQVSDVVMDYEKAIEEGGYSSSRKNTILSSASAQQVGYAQAKGKSCSIV